MATFLETQGMRNQEHFEVFEIDLPVITGACTIGGSPGFGTPLTCDQVWTGEYKTYKFTNENCPVVLPGSPWRVIRKISETATELKPGDGLSSRGSLKISLIDFDKQDPNKGAPGVTDIVKNQGTYLGKLEERQIFENRRARLKLYRVQPDGSVDLVNGAQTRNYVTNTFTAGSNDLWDLSCKDVLSLANLSEKAWPIATGGFLRTDIDSAVVAIPVDEETDYSSAFAVRIGDEFLEIISVTDNLTATAKLNVKARGSSIFAPVSGELLTITNADDHSGGDEVFICELSDNETIDSLITRVLVDSDFDPALIPTVDWAAEVAEWHANDKINTLHSESKDVNAVLKKILGGFLMDIWFSTTENEAKLSAISVWKQSSTTLTEGKEINAYSIKKQAKESLRASRALIVYDKRNLADDDSKSSYKKASQFADNTLISEALFSKHKDKLFESNDLIGTDAAILLTQRWVSRFKFTPYVRAYMVEEQYLTFNTGDVVDIISSVDQSADGSLSTNIRAQILKINPQYTNTGRRYKVEAMTYEAAFGDGAEIVLDSPLGESNLYILAGAPSQPVTITFILSAYSFGSTGFRAGAFPTGSKIILILADGFDGQANGGGGGKGESIYFDDETLTWTQTTPAQSGGDGGTVYDAQGVDTDIYFSGATPSAAYPIADGYIRAPGGGGDGKLSQYIGNGPGVAYGGNGGGGGAGRNIGGAGAGGDAISGTNNNTGASGVNGDIIGNGGAGGSSAFNISGEDGAGWGIDAISGLAGSGIIDSGATVVLFGDTPTRYINGSGDHP